MADRHRPKRWSGTLRRIAGGTATAVPAWVAEAVFLAQHPGWTSQAYRDADASVIRLMTEYERQTAEVAKHRQRVAEAQSRAQTGRR